MKVTKKLLALVFTVIMIAGMGMCAFAEGNYSINIAPVKNATLPHSYVAYQILRGDIAENDDGDKVLSNAVFGENADVAAINEAGYADVAAFTKALEAVGGDDIGLFLKPFITGTAVAGASQKEPTDEVAITGLDDGYYFVEDVTDLDGTSDSYSSYIVQVVGSNIEVKAKADVPSAEKRVDRYYINEQGQTRPAGMSHWATYDIGDSILFDFKSKIVDNIDSYKNGYFYIFHDELSEGLTFEPNTVHVFVGIDDIVDQCEVVITEKGFDVKTPNLQGLMKPGQEITVTYNATLNEKAVCAGEGNPNTLVLEYSNNPNGDGTGKTPPSTNIVFTFKVGINKVNENQEPLQGAEFVLEKLNAFGNWLEVGKVLGTGQGGKLTDSNGVYEVSGDGTKFTWKGLDIGDYRIKETVTPTGYNTISDEYIYFTVVADVQEDAAGLIVLKDYAVQVDKDQVVGEYVFNPEDDSLTATVINQSGSILPSTGGMGTTILYIIGAILVCGAGAILFVRKKMSNY